MSRGNIVIDCDDVIVDLKTLLVGAFNKELDLNKESKDLTDYDLTKVFNIPFDDVLGLFHKYNIIQNSKIFDYSVDAINRINEMGFTPICLTARGWHNDAERLTREYFEEHNVKIDNVIILPDGMNKGEYLSKSGILAHSFIDDNFTHAKSVSDSKMVDKIYLRNETWNQDFKIDHISNMERVDTLCDMATIIENNLLRGLSNKSISDVLIKKELAITDMPRKLKLKNKIGIN